MTHSESPSNSSQSQNFHEITRILQDLDADINQTDALIPLVYDELRHIAANKLANEAPGHTLQATALTHEAYLRLLDPKSTWNNRRHFFGAAAEAMRRILIDNARRKKAKKRGENPKRQEGAIEQLIIVSQEVNLLDLNEALDELERQDPEAAELVKLRYFAGLTMPQIANTMGFSLRKSENIWAFARAWLYQHLNEQV